MYHRDPEYLINPFILPAETDGRFTMLVMSAVMITLYISMIVIGMISLLIGPYLIADFPLVFQEMRYVSTAVEGRTILELSDTEIRSLANKIVVGYLTALINGLPRLLLVGLLLLLVVGGACALYYAHPTLIRRRQRLRTLNDFNQPAQAAQVQASIHAIAKDVRLEPPTVLIRTDTHTDGQVFGLPGRYMLRLNARPLSADTNELHEIIRREPKQFRALILHELGHIANGDIGRSRFAEAISHTVIWLVLVPLALAIVAIFGLMSLWIAQQSAEVQSEFIRQSVWRVIVLVLQFGALIIFILASRRELIRVREYYADWRAQLWGADKPLKSMLEQTIQSEQLSRADDASASGWLRHARSIGAAVWSWWCRLWRFHTPAQQRLDQLTQPLSLFAVTSNLAFHTGILLALVTAGIIMLTIYIGIASTELIEIGTWSLIRAMIDSPGLNNRQLYLGILLGRWLLGAICGFGLSLLLPYLSTGSLGRQVQRAAIADLLPSTSQTWGFFWLWKPALWISIGEEVGLWMLPASPFISRSLLSLSTILIWIVSFAILIWLWLIYLRALSQFVLGSHSGQRLPRHKRWFVTGCAIVGLSLLYLPVMLGRLAVGSIEHLPYYLDLTASVMPNFQLVFMVSFTLWMLFVAAIVLFSGWAAVTLGGAWLWRRIQRLRCPVCGEHTRHTVAVGQHCPLCYSNMAPWLYSVRRRIA